MDLPVVILCGGFGTRMGPVTDTIPKPMVEVGGRPLLWHVLKTYARHGARRFVLCLGYKGEVIRGWAESRPEPGWDLTLVDTGDATTTAGRLLRVRQHLGPGTWCMTYGDGVADVDLPGLLARHEAQGRVATVTAMRPRSRFGVLDLAGPTVERFREKPLLEQRVSGGYFVFEAGAFDWMRDDEPLEEGALGRLATAGQLAAWPHDGFWLSVDTPRDLAELNRLYDDGERRWLEPS